MILTAARIQRAERTYQLSGHDDQPLIRKVVLLVVIHSLDRDDIRLQAESGQR